MGALDGQAALVTGGSRGIGRATAARLIRAGARVAIVARGRDGLTAAGVETGARVLQADVADEAAIEALPDRAREVLGAPPDILVNAAGVFGLAAFEHTRVEDLDLMLAVNLRAPFLLIRAFLPAMLEGGRGHVVSVGSVAGRQAFHHNGAYSASKFGLRGMHAVLDAELRGRGVRATLVEPAATATGLWDAVDARAHPELPERSAMLEPDDVADAILYAVTRRPGIGVRNLLLERA